MKNTGSGRLLVVAVVSFLGLALAGCSAKVSTGAGGTPPGSQAPRSGGAEDSSSELRAEPYWFSCKTDADCIMEAGVCGQPEAVNPQYLEKYRDFRDRLAQMIECTARPVLPEVVQTQCVKHRCVLKGEKS